ncbi:MAG: hypothetical protein V4616_11715, partial [Bacteroidota bacterium]
MRRLITLLFLCAGFTAFSQGTFTYKGGVWGSAASWTLSSGMDVDNIPDADDIVNVTGFNLSITDSRSCAQLTIQPSATAGSQLDITGTGALTVLGDLNAANARYTDNTINVLGNLTVGGILGLKPSSSRGNIFLNIGDATHSPTIICDGFTTSRTDASATYTTTTTLYQGVFDIHGPLLGSGSTSPIGNFINVNDDGAFDGLQKRIFYSGLSTSATNTRVKLTLLDSDGDADYTFVYNGSSAQNFLFYGTNFTYKDVYISNSAGAITSYLLDVNQATAIKGHITINSGSTLNDFGRATLLNPGTIIVSAGATYRRMNASAYDLASLDMDQASTFEFNATGTTTRDIFTQHGTYYAVKLSGPAPKRITAANSVDDIEVTAGSITLTEGTLNTAVNAALELNGAGQTKTLTLQSGTTWTISGDLISSTASFYSFNLDSKVSYNRSGTQTVYDFKNSGGTTEAYGNLDFSGSSVKSIVGGSNIQVRNRVTFGTT